MGYTFLLSSRFFTGDFFMNQHSSFSKAIFTPDFIDRINPPDLFIGKSSLSHTDRFFTVKKLPDYLHNQPDNSAAMPKDNSSI